MPVAYRILAVGALVLALSTWEATALADPADIPTDLRLREIKSVTRDWRPHACETSARTRVICAIEKFMACGSFERTDLCEEVGWYPSRIPQHAYDVYGEGSFEPFPKTPAVRQYRLQEFRNLDARYSPPLLVIHLESRICYRGGPPPDCGQWWPVYYILSHLDTTGPDVAEWGTLVPTP
jgi:hypothetical protein